MPKRSTSVTKAVLCAALVLCACQSVGHSPAGSSPTTAATSTADALTRALGRAAAPRRIIRDAELTLGVADAEVARASLTRIAEAAGGYVATSQTTGSGDAAARASEELGIRVPAERFTDVLGRIHDLGKLSSEQVTSRDVTDDFVDLDARIAAAQAVEKQYVAMLAKATSVNDMLAVQRELASVRSDLERMLGKQRVLADQTALSSINVRITVPLPLVTASWRAIKTDATEAGASVVNVSADLVSIVLRLLGVLLPVSALLGAPAYFALRPFIRRGRLLRATNQR